MNALLNIRAVAAALLLSVFAACTSHVDTASLAGTYGVTDKSGQVTPFVKIEAGDASKGEFVLYEYRKGEWKRPKQAWSDNPTYEPVKPFKKEDLEKLVHHKLDVDVDGVQTRGFAFVHVPAGWSDTGDAHGFTTKTGFFAMTLIGPVELVRM
ncbi:hypothetical protein [Paraburkholderia largidicola]|uniref:Lipoprotein n=1 Tax=Paraburkholderia largidicola TaxID=3014751 RepID=A0A7I8C300_9BURK|nr:hypothetical protein [Paraburkholderia sp. PGU16]BCF95414.1 hypothetical protein PPGU16_84810 [Paraburkholderia sp. PGU16]